MNTLSQIQSHEQHLNSFLPKVTCQSFLPFFFFFFHGSSAVRHRVLGDVSSVKKEGGIQWLHNRDDEHDENNTWNGNSTQQM